MRHVVQLATIASVALLSVSPAHAASNKDTVVDDDRDVLVNSFGNCVRSTWQDDMDECAPPPPEPEKKPVVQEPVVMPKKAERTVYFDFNSAELAESETIKIDKLVNWLAGAKGVTGATVYGYADQIGNADYNQQLSMKRAKAVEDYLASRGVVLPTSVEIVKGLGETDSITSCDQTLPRKELIACLAADRRVEIMFETLR